MGYKSAFDLALAATELPVFSAIRPMVSLNDNRLFRPGFRDAIVAIERRPAYNTSPLTQPQPWRNILWSRGGMC